MSGERLRGLPRPLLEALRAELGPRFVNAQQRAFFDSQAAEVLYSGAFRAGKSRIGAEKAYWLAQRYPGIPIGIFRKTAASLAASTERSLLVDVVPRAAIVRSHAGQHWYELANGSRIWLFGLDPDPLTGVPSKVGSVELGWAFIDEAAECSLADWIMVKGRLSWPGVPYHQLTAATNPAGPGHWLKARFTPPSPSRVYLHASTFDNPTLAADYLAEARAAPDDHYHRRYHLGEWVASEGTIWNLPDDQVRSPEQTDWQRVTAGVDWGYQHAFACEVVGGSGSGRLAVLTELYERQRTLDELIPSLIELQRRYRIERFFADPSEPAYIEQCRRAGLEMTKAENAVLPGITAVSAAIAAGMTVDPACRGLLEELPTYTWRPDRSSGELSDVPIKAHDDACLVAGTLIATRHGAVPIERVRAGDAVLTRRGLREVLGAGLTNPAGEVVELRTNDGRSLVGTPNHPVWVEGSGFVRLDAMPGVIERPARAAVYNLTVAGEHEYFANGILTHNCDALRYAVMAQQQPAEPGILTYWKQLAAEAKAARAGGG